MIDLRVGARIWLATGITDMQCRFQGLSAQVQTAANALVMFAIFFIYLESFGLAISSSRSSWEMSGIIRSSE